MCTFRDGWQEFDHRVTFLVLMELVIQQSCRNFELKIVQTVLCECGVLPHSQCDGRRDIGRSY